MANDRLLPTPHQTGRAVISGAGKTVTYTPNASLANFAGADAFNYTITDGFGATAVGLITVSNPYFSLKGRYAGTVTAGNGADTGMAQGVLSLTLTGRGSFTGSLELAGTKCAFSGSFALSSTDPTSLPTATVTLKNGPTLALTFNPADGQGRAAGIAEVVGGNCDHDRAVERRPAEGANGGELMKPPFRTSFLPGPGGPSSPGEAMTQVLHWRMRQGGAMSAAMKKAIALFVCAVIAAAHPSFAGDAAWPRFRGPNGAGVADEEKPPVEFGPEKNVLWKTAVPSGPSSPCIWGTRIFLTAFDEGKLWTLCLDRATGRELWKRDAHAEKIEPFLEGQGSPAAATPATDGERVVVYFGSCGLIAYDFEGKELWRHPLPVAETNNDFGSGTSPILVDGLCILNRDLKADSALLAVDAATGMQVWKTARPGMATSYSTPIVWEHDGVKELVVGGGLALRAYDPSSGAERWVVRNVAAVDCTSPVTGGGLLYFASWSVGVDAPMPSFDDLLKADANGDGKLSKAESEHTFLKGFFDANDPNKDGFITRDEWEAMLGYLKRGKNRLIAVKPGGSGDITESHVAWEKTKGLPYVPSALLYRGRVFLVKDGGLASCFDAATGETKYEQARLGMDGSFYASPVAANGHIYLVNLTGKAAVVEAGDKPEVISRADFGERCAATPAIVENTIYLRTATTLFAFREAK